MEGRGIAVRTDRDADPGIDPDLAANLDELQRRHEAILERFGRVFDGDSVGMSTETWGRNSPFHPGR